MKCPFCIKVCVKCKKILVACSINFDKKKCGKYGLRADCKVCRAKYHKQYRKEHKEELKERKKEYYNGTCACRYYSVCQKALCCS